MKSRIIAAALVICSASVLAVACSDSTASGMGNIAVRLTDAPSDSVKSVDVFVTRIDARVAEADSAETERGSSSDSAEASGWRTLATPNRSFDLIRLHLDTASLGTTPVPAGTYRALRLIIDPSKSSVTLKDGTVLTRTSSPSVNFPSGATSGIKVKFLHDGVLNVTTGGTVQVTLDFDVNESFNFKGSHAHTGFTFKPVIRAVVVTK